jgi:hypothetical protein
MGWDMTQQFSRIALFAAAIGLVNTGAFAQQAGGATRGSSTGQTTSQGNDRDASGTAN